MGEYFASFLKAVSDLKEKLMIFTLNVPKPLIFLLLIIGFLLLIVAFAVKVFTFGFVRMGWLYVLGILMIGYSLIVALLPSGVLRKEQVERNIRKNLKYSETLCIIASDEASKRKVIQVALKTLFRPRKEEPEKKFVVFFFEFVIL